MLLLCTLVVERRKVIFTEEINEILSNLVNNFVSLYSDPNLSSFVTVFSKVCFALTLCYTGSHSGPCDVTRGIAQKQMCLTLTLISAESLSEV